MSSRTGFIDAFPLGRHVPQGLKPAFFRALKGTAEAVPYPKPIYETSSRDGGVLFLAHVWVEGCTLLHPDPTNDLAKKKCPVFWARILGLTLSQYLS